MNLQLTRYSDNGESTQGLLHEISLENGAVFKGYTLEDEAREEKVPKETCIPSGHYEIKFNENDTPLTLRYRDKFQWFTYHLELQDVTGFSYVYIHIGNSDKDTDGCILLANSANNNTIEKGFNSRSAQAFTQVYNDISRKLLNEEKVFIKVKDVKDIIS